MQKTVTDVVSITVFEKALPTLRPEIHRYCSRMMGSVIDGEDILQIAMMKAFEAIERGDEVANLRGWLFRIAHNTALDVLRAKKREVTMHDTTKPLQPTYAEMPDRSEVVESFRPFMALPPGQRSSVIFKDVFGYTTGEVADLTDTTIASVKAALHRGRRALRNFQDMPPEPSKPISSPEKQQLTMYAQLFNDRKFDDLRDLLSQEVRLELVARTHLAGKDEVGSYFSNYARVHDWLMMPGQVEGRPALLAFDQEDISSGPVYFVLLRFVAGKLEYIRDFRYARYVIAGAEWERLS
ncbi:MAG: sigma-70 family RNA polymerase sigma factor [Sneathiella sp.]